MRGISGSESFFESIHSPKYLTRFNVYTNMTLPCGLVGERQIEADRIHVEITSHSFINTPRGFMRAGWYPTGKKLAFDGQVDVKVVFSCPKERNKLCGIQEGIRFSESIQVPPVICDEESPIIKHLVEDVTYGDVGGGKLLVSILLTVGYMDRFPEEQGERLNSGDGSV